jgi:hypothetical protein
MTTPQPDQRRRAAERPEGGAAMDTFTVGFPRWLAVPFSRNPLVRPSDRIEALALTLVMVVSLLSIPIGAAVGTAVYDSRSRIYAEQAKTRITVTATVIDVPARSDTTRVHARWVAAGSEHTGAIKARSVLKPGDSIDIPVTSDGSYAGPPGMSAATEAVAVALAIWLNATGLAAALFAGTRAILNRARHASWQSDFVQLVGGGSRP